MADRLYTSSEADEVLSALRFETKLEKATLARIAFVLSLIKDGPKLDFVHARRLTRHNRVRRSCGPAAARLFHPDPSQAAKSRYLFRARDGSAPRPACPRTSPFALGTTRPDEPGSRLAQCKAWPAEPRPKRGPVRQASGAQWPGRSTGAGFQRPGELGLPRRSSRAATAARTRR